MNYRNLFLKINKFVCNCTLLAFVSYSSISVADTYEVKEDKSEDRILIRIESSGVPPDPGNKGKLGLQGVDSDSDGVRDDIERYIVYKYPNEPSTRKALYQFSQALQNVLRTNDPNRQPDSSNPDPQAYVERAYERVASAIRCLMLRREDDASVILKDIEIRHLNTKERFIASQKAERMVSGKITPIFSGSIKSDCQQ